LPSTTTARSCAPAREHTSRRIDPEPAVTAASLRAASVLGLRFAGVDLKADIRGRFRLLEVNRSPMFLGFEARGGGDVLRSLARALAGATAKRR
jgi:glutathione synthase/RimK-type ligase-like ATP-grasp enzyme